MAKTILIVDDSASIRQVVGMTLKTAGYDVLEGVDAGRADPARRPQGPPDHQRREHAEHGRHHLPEERQAAGGLQVHPVIMLTTEAGDAKKAEGQAAGAKAVVKPFQPAQMLTAVSKLILP